MRLARRLRKFQVSRSPKGMNFRRGRWLRRNGRIAAISHNRKLLIDRRNVLFGLTGAAAPLLIRSTVAYGQSASPNTGDALNPSPFVAQTLQIGTLAKMTSQIALQNSQNASVRRFAKLEIAEQTAVLQSLTSNFNPPPAPLTDD